LPLLKFQPSYIGLFVTLTKGRHCGTAISTWVKFKFIARAVVDTRAVASLSLI